MHKDLRQDATVKSNKLNKKLDLALQAIGAAKSGLNLLNEQRVSDMCVQIVDRLSNNNLQVLSIRRNLKEFLVNQR